MLYSEIIAVYSQIHTNQVNTLCGQKVEFLNVKLVVHIVTIGLERVDYFEMCFWIAWLWCVTIAVCLWAHKDREHVFTHLYESLNRTRDEESETLKLSLRLGHIRTL